MFYFILNIIQLPRGLKIIKNRYHYWTSPKSQKVNQKYIKISETARFPGARFRFTPWPRLLLIKATWLKNIYQTLTML